MATTSSEQSERQREALVGAGLVLTSGLGFGAVPVLARVAYDGGSTAPTSLLVRFTVAAVLLWGLLALRGQLRPLPERRIAGLVLMGTFLSGSATTSFIAVQRIPAALLFYVYPALITLASALLYGTRYTLSRLLVLLASLIGSALTVDVQSGSLNVLGVALAISSTFFYTGYVLVASRATRGVPALNASAWVITAAASLLLLAGATGLVGDRLTTHVSGVGWLAMLGLALFSTVLSISTFRAGIARINVFRAAILSTFEPVVSVTLAAQLLNERLTPQQGLGGADRAWVRFLRLTTPTRSHATHPAPGR